MPEQSNEEKSLEQAIANARDELQSLPADAPVTQVTLHVIAELDTEVQREIVHRGYIEKQQTMVAAREKHEMAMDMARQAEAEKTGDGNREEQRTLSKAVALGATLGFVLPYAGLAAVLVAVLLSAAKDAYTAISVIAGGAILAGIVGQLRKKHTK